MKDEIGFPFQECSTVVLRLHRLLILLDCTQRQHFEIRVWMRRHDEKLVLIQCYRAKRVPGDQDSTDCDDEKKINDIDDESDHGRSLSFEKGQRGEGHSTLVRERDSSV